MARDHVQERALPRPVGTDEAHDLARLDVETDTIDGVDAPEAHGDVAHRHGQCHRRAARARIGQHTVGRRRVCRGGIEGDPGGPPRRDLVDEAAPGRISERRKTARNEEQGD